MAWTGSAWVLLSFSQFPVRHPGADPGTVIQGDHGGLSLHFVDIDLFVPLSALSAWAVGQANIGQNGQNGRTPKYKSTKSSLKPPLLPCRYICYSNLKQFSTNFQVTTLYYRSELDIPLSEMGPNHTVIERTIDNSKADIFVLKHESSIFRSFIQPCMWFWKCQASSPEAKQYIV